MPLSKQYQRPSVHLAHLALGTSNFAKGSTLNAKVVADGIRNRQIASLKLGSESFKCAEQPDPCHVDHARCAERRTTRQGHLGPRPVDLVEQGQQGVTAER